MIALALGLSAALLAIAAALRFGGASMLRTNRADALRDAAMGLPGATRVAVLLEDPTSVQPSLGMVHVALLVSAGIPAAWALTALASGPALLGLLVALGLLLVLAGDTLPRAFGRAAPRRPAYRLSRLLAGAVHLGRRAADFMSEGSDATESGEGDDEALVEEKELISSVLEFTDAIVREVMVPRTDMVTLSAANDTDKALDVVIECGRSRIPVTGDDLDDVVGVLYARDLLGLFDSGRGPQPVSRLMRPVRFVPETKRVSELLRELQASKVHLAVVVDEFGGTAGLVTIEDLLEEIVGEIVDEYDTEELMFQVLPEGGFLLDARLPVDEAEELLGVTLPGEDWDTVGGLMLGLAGRVPEEGEAFSVAGMRLVAEKVQGRRISSIRVVPE